LQIRRLLERIGIRSTPAQQSTWSDSDEAVQNQLRKERLELKKELERFHGLYEIAGKFYHIDGIFSGYPENWNNMKSGEKWNWRDELARRYGMPENVCLKSFWVD